jgi:CRISPR-associated protein (TIGR02584 family)
MPYREPHEHPRRILLASTGLAPQILTETLYALAVTSVPAFVPTEIHVVTTEEGRHRLMLTLLDPSTARLREFAQEFSLPGLDGALSPERIHVFVGPDGRPLPDIAAEADNAAAADLTTRMVRALTADPDAALHVSLAGGRKTMGFLLGYALSLFGRPQDRLSHVLVDRAFEMHPDFFYPPKRPRVLTTRDGRPINTADARLLLADIPIVRLRLGLPQDLLDGEASYSETVARAEQGFVETDLVIDHRTRRIACHGTAIALPPLPFAIYAWLARRRMLGRGDGGATHWWEADPAELLAEYAAIGNLPGGALEEHKLRLAGGIPAETLEQNNSRINRALRAALGYFATGYAIKPRGLIPGTKYVRIGLTLDPGAIRFGPIEAEDAAQDAAPKAGAA